MKITKATKGREGRGTPAPNPTAVAADMAQTLRSWRDPGRAAGVQRYFKVRVEALGIETERLRVFGAEQVRRLRPHWTAKHALRACEALLREPEIECRGLGLFLLTGFQIGLDSTFLQRAEAWLGSYLDNWALVDSFCSSILSPLLDREPTMEEALGRWSVSEGLWLRRAALVTLIPGVRRGRRLDLAYRLAQEHLGDPEDLMHKATGWLLREAGKPDVSRLRRFLRKQGPGIPRTALRYAIERFPAVERQSLLRETRAGRPPRSGGGQ